MVETLPGVIRLKSHEPMLEVMPRGFSRFLLSGSVPRHRDPGLELQSRVGQAAVALAERSTAFDAYRALERGLPRGVHAHATKLEQGVDVQLNETLVPAAKLPLAQIFTTDLRQRVRRLDDNAFELVGPTGGACLVTVRIDTRRSLIPVGQQVSAASTVERIAARAPAGYRAETKGPVITFWKDADLRTIAA